MRKIVSVSMVIILLVTLLIGCSKDKVKNTDNLTTVNEVNESKGRYVEEEIAYPEEAGNGRYVSLTASPEGKFELYIFNNDNNKYEKYLYVDKKWVKDSAEGLQVLKNSNLNYITDVFYGEDGRQYLLGDTMEYHNVLYRLSDKGVYEKVAIQKFDETNGDWKSIYRAAIVKVLQNGMIAVSYMNGELEVYSPDGSKVKEFTSAEFGKLAVEKNILYYTSADGNQLLSYNMETDKQEGTLEINIQLSDNGILELDQTTTYLCDTDGIHLIHKNGSLWETIVDGNQTSLNMPSVAPSKFIIGTEEDFYVVLKDNNSSLMKHYYFDNNVSSVPPTELSIFSIEDNKTIRQAISMFQESHPDVKINYRTAKINQKVVYTYGLTNPKETVTQADYIKTLNTELLAKKGADILVLDGLPIDSYIEKGVLEDMGSIFSSMLDNGELLGIADQYVKEGKVYAMPARFSLPIIYGNGDAVNSAGSFAELVEYAHNNKELPLLKPCNYRSLAAWFLLLYYDQIIGEKEEFDEASLKDFFERLSILAADIKASDDVQKDFSGLSDILNVGYWVSGVIDVHKKVVQTNIEEVSSLNELAVPLAAAVKWNGTYKIVNNTYRAHTLVGMNSAGKQKELAKEFIRFLFSKEIQNVDLYDGFPMNKASMEEWVQKQVDGSITIGSDDYKIQANYPWAADREKLYENIKALSRPMVNDMTQLDMILDEAERYLRGDITAEKAAANAVNSLNTYLNE